VAGQVSRIYRVVAIVSALIAAVIVLAAGATTPGYDPISKTISRLAVTGMPSAVAVDSAILLVALTCFALTALLAPGASKTQAALLISGGALIVTALVHLDPVAEIETTVHRVASGIAVLGLTAAPFLQAGPYRRVSVAVGLGEAGMLLAAPVLLATSFDAWGAWERCLLVLALAWMVLMATTTPSADENASARAASVSSSGS
jgi:hypothetical protein